MRIKQVGQKLHNYGTRLGHKLFSGVKSLGQKVYDNKYKLLAGLGATIATGVATSMNMNTTGTKIPNKIHRFSDSPAIGLLPPKSMNIDNSDYMNRDYANRYFD